MMRVVRSGCAVAVSLWFLAHPAIAQADPIVIPSGTIVGNAYASAASIDVQGPEFSFTGFVEGYLANLASCIPCASPTPVVDLGATFDRFSSGGGTGVIEGITYPLVYVGFSSGTFTTPTATLTELGESLVDVPFTFTAVMNGYLEHPLTRPSDAPPIFTVDLAGSGRASARFFGLIDENGARSFSVLPRSPQYEFMQSQPVPEPGTLLLVGGAIGALAARRLSRRKDR